MRKRFHRRPGKLIQAKPLTELAEQEYDVVAVNNDTRQIVFLGKVISLEEAKELKRKHSQKGFKYYTLENNSVSLEIE